MINRRSTEGMSFELAAVSLVCSSLWLCYGIMLDNGFIYVPNVLGVIFSVSQVILPRLFEGNRMCGTDKAECWRTRIDRPEREKDRKVFD